MTKVCVNYTVTRESITFALGPAERLKYPHGRNRVVLGFDEPPSLQLVSLADAKAIGNLLSNVPEAEIEVEFVDPCE